MQITWKTEGDLIIKQWITDRVTTSPLKNMEEILQRVMVVIKILLIKEKKEWWKEIPRIPHPSLSRWWKHDFLMYLHVFCASAFFFANCFFPLSEWIMTLIPRWFTKREKRRCVFKKKSFFEVGLTDTFWFVSPLRVKQKHCCHGYDRFQKAWLNFWHMYRFLLLLFTLLLL